MNLTDQKASIEYIQNEKSIWQALENTAALCLSDVTMIEDVECSFTIEEMDAAFKALQHVESL